MINRIFVLPTIEQITPVLSRRQLDEFEVFVVDHPQIKASFALQDAYLLSWKPNSEEEVLWLSNNTPFGTDVALRGGVPICWPWFGPAAKQDLPPYGSVRNLPQTLKARNGGGNGVMLASELQSSAETRQLQPRRSCLLACFRVGVTCEVELEAHGEFGTTSVLHAYFNVGDITIVKVSGLGDRLIDRMNDTKEDALAGRIQTFPDHTDRVYLNPGVCSMIHDGTLDHNIDVVYHHHLDVVGWSPGSALSVSMGSMPDDGYKTSVYAGMAYMIASQKTTEERPFRPAQTIRVAKY